MGFFKSKNKTVANDDSLDIPPPPPMNPGAPAPQNNFLRAPQASPPPQETPYPPQMRTPSPPPMNMPSPPQMRPSYSQQMSPPSMPPPDMPPMDTPYPEGIQNFPPPGDDSEGPSTDFEIPPISHPDHEALHQIPEDEQPYQNQSFNEIIDNQPNEPQPVQRESTPMQITVPSSYVEVSKYRQILRDLNNIRKSLKDADTEIDEIITDINDEEKTFGTLNSTLGDIEQKLSQLENDFFTER